MSEAEPKSEGLLEEAAAWFARMRAPDAESSRADFEAWLARGALHRAAYNRAAEIFAMGKFLTDEPARESAAADPTPTQSRRLLLAAACTAFLIILASAWLVLRAISSGELVGNAKQDSRRFPQMAELAAGRAAQAVTLADGSVVELRPATGIAVDFSRTLRRLTLERGSARFFVAHEVRPFMVRAGGGTIVAVGTIFDVGLAGKHQVIVRLIKGVIEVTPPSAPAGTGNPAPRRLRAGQAFRFTAAPAAVAATQAADSAAPPLNAAEARDFDSIPLADLVRLANAHAARPIRLADPDIAADRVETITAERSGSRRSSRPPTPSCLRQGSPACSALSPMREIRTKSCFGRNSPARAPKIFFRGGPVVPALLRQPS